MLATDLRIFVFAYSAVLLDARYFESKEKPAAAKPNIIFILADDLGWADVSFHGYSEFSTPHIDRLATEGVILNSYYAQHLCTPSRAALLTGKYPIHLGLQHRIIGAGEPRGLDLGEKLLPQYLKDLGYATHLIGKWHLGYYKKAFTPTYRGFDSFFGFYNGYVDYYNYTHSGKVPPDYAGSDLWEGTAAAEGYIGQYATDVFTNKSVQIVDNHDFAKPLFLFVSHLAPHHSNHYEPVQAPSKQTARFPHISHDGRLRYAGTMGALDDSVGDIKSSLDRRGVLNNTIIIFASDNGGLGPEREPFLGSPYSYSSNWPLRGGKATQWEGGVRVVAVVWSHLIESPTRVSSGLYHVTDWLPTLYRLAGGTGFLQPNDGMDIWNSISTGAPSPRTEVLLQADTIWGEYALRWRQYKLVLGSWKGVQKPLDQWYEPASGWNASYYIGGPGALLCGTNNTITSCNAATAACLFDVEQDPCEYVNLADVHPDTVTFMMAKLRAYNASAVPCRILPLDPRARAVLNNGLLQPWDTK